MLSYDMDCSRVNKTREKGLNVDEQRTTKKGVLRRTVRILLFVCSFGRIFQEVIFFVTYICTKLVPVKE
jgi:hypothetical protein